MQLKINRYSIFYTLYIYFLIITILPTKYNGIPFGAHPIIALSIYTLIILLPIQLLLILVLEIINKRFKVVFKNILIIIAIFAFTWFFKTQILDIYVYSKPHTSKEVPAEPPMEKLDEK